MAVDVDATITNNSNNKGYTFRGVNSWKYKRSQPVINIPFIQTAAENTILFRFMGQTEKASFGFLIFDDGTDTSAGTHAPAPITVDDQIAYLRDQIFTHEFDTDWNFSDNNYYKTTVIVTITDLDMDSRAGAPAFVTGAITVQRGKIGVLG